jgi:hypothetical protein
MVTPDGIRMNATAVVIAVTVNHRPFPNDQDK